MLREFRTQRIIWDRANSRLFDPIQTSGGDQNGRRLEVQILNNGEVEDLTGTDLYLAWQTRNKTHSGLEPFDTLDASEGTFELYYPTGMLAHAGALRGGLALVDSDGRIVSREFIIQVDRNIVDDEAAESSNEFTALTEALVKINDLEGNYAPRLNEVTAQLGQKASQAELNALGQLRLNGTYATLSALQTALPNGAEGLYLVTDDGFVYRWSGTSWVQAVQFQSTGIADKSIDIKHTNFIKVSTNLYDKSKVTRGYQISPSTGVISESSTYTMSGFFPCEPSTPYSFKGFSSVFWYDANYEFITGASLYYEGRTRTSWSTAKYMRVHYQHEQVDNELSQINKGNELLPFEPFYRKLDESITASSSEVQPSHNLSTVLTFEVAGLNKTTGQISKSLTDERDHDTKVRTGKFLNVAKGTPLKLTYNVGKAFIFEYDKNFNYIKNTKVTTGTTITLSSNTTLVKVVVEGLTPQSQSNVNGTIEFHSYYDRPKWVYNQRISSSNISFTYEVNPTKGRDILSTDSNEEQYTTNRYYNSGLLKLPINYRPDGDPVKLIIFCHGSGSYNRFTNQTFGSAYEDYFQYLSDEGYALLDVYSWTTKYEEARINFGSPIAMSALVQGYKWAVTNYNIDKTGVFVSGKSAGGFLAFNVIYNKGVPVLGAGVLAPVISPLPRPFGYNAIDKLAYADDFGFVGDTEGILGIEGDKLPRTQELKDYIMQNAEKIVGYNGYWNGLVGISLETLAYHGAEETDDDPNLFEGVSRVTNVPQKIWVSEDDPRININRLKNYIQTIKNGQGIGELRLMPNNTGEHHSVDSSPDALKVDTITTRLGITHTNVPLAYVEMLQFFRRFEN